MIFLATHARWVLVAGLIAGVVFPSWAAVLTPYLRWMVAVILCLSAFRIGPGLIAGLPRAAKDDVRAVFVLQLCVPVGIVLVGLMMGQGGHPLVLALALMSAAPPIMSAPSLCQMMGGGGTRAMRLLVLGTCLMPLSVLPVLWLLFGGARFSEAVTAALTLAVLVIGAIGLGAWGRRIIGEVPPRRLQQLDGVTAVLLAVFVVALMPSVAQTWAESPTRLMVWMAAAFAANFGLQWIVWRVTGSVDLSVAGGNRNMSLFLAALPGETIAPALAFLGCYQIPMFLTPLVMRRLYQGGIDQKER